MFKKMLFIASLSLVLITASKAELSDTVWCKYTYPVMTYFVKFTPDGLNFVSGGSDGIPKLWESNTGKLVREFPGVAPNYDIFPMTMNNSGEIIATAYADYKIRIYEVGTAKIINTIIPSAYNLSVGDLCFSNDGKLFVAYIGGKINNQVVNWVIIYNTIDWKEIASISLPFPTNSISFSKNDSILAISQANIPSNLSDSVQIYLYSTSKWGLVKILKTSHNGLVNKISFSNSNSFFASAIDPDGIKIWNTSDWSLFRNFSQGSDSRALAFSPDNKYLVAGGGNFKEYTTDIWDLSLGIKKYSYNNKYLFKQSDGDLSISINNNASLIAFGGGGGIYMLNAKWNPTSVSEKLIQIKNTEIFPNPVNKVANIQFELIRQSQISINIYDVRGNLIEQIYNGNLEVGLQNFQWNTSNSLSGTYYCRITASGNTSTIKIIVNK